MPFPSRFLAGIAAALIITNAPAATLRIYLIGGQSNASGHAQISELPPALQAPMEDVPFYYGPPEKGSTVAPYTTLRPAPIGTNFGPEVTFAHDFDAWLKKTAPTDKLAIIKFAIGGTHLFGHWKADGTSQSTADGNVYRAFQKSVSEGLTAFKDDPSLKSYNQKICGMLWVQGEADINEHAAEYSENLKRFIKDIRATYGANIPFYLSQISLNQKTFNSTPERKKELDLVRTAQKQVAASVPNTYLIETDGPAFTTYGDNLHFNGAGQQALGSAFAKAVIATAKKF
jgi:hypothetical protein